MKNRTYTYTYLEDDQRYPCARVTRLDNGLAKYENLISLFEEIIPEDEAFAKAREKAELLNCDELHLNTVYRLFQQSPITG